MFSHKRRTNHRYYRTLKIERPSNGEKGSVSPLVEIQYRPLRPEIQAFALQKCHFVAAFAGYFRGLCSVYVVFRCWFGIVKSFTEFQPNKIHYREKPRLNQVYDVSD